MIIYLRLLFREDGGKGFGKQERKGKVVMSYKQLGVLSGICVVEVVSESFFGFELQWYGKKDFFILFK